MIVKVNVYQEFNDIIEFIDFYSMFNPQAVMEVIDKYLPEGFKAKSPQHLLDFFPKAHEQVMLEILDKFPEYYDVYYDEGLDVYVVRQLSFN